MRHIFHRLYKIVKLKYKIFHKLSFITFDYIDLYKKLG